MAVKKAVAMVALSVAMVACGRTQYTPITKKMIDPETNEIVETVIGGTTDSHVAREVALYDAWKTRDLAYQQMYKESGTQLEFGLVVVNGVQMYLPTKMIIREAPRFSQPLPTTPSEHPFWKFGNNLVEKGLWGWLSYNMFDTIQELAGAPKGNQFNFQGSYGNEFNESFNPSEFSMTGRDNLGGSLAPYTVDPKIVEPTIVHPVIVPAAE